MIHEDELAVEADRLGFVLHLGDFIYGGPPLYLVHHRAAPWRPGEALRLEQRVLEGNPRFSV
jgi:hypothetical protein